MWNSLTPGANPSFFDSLFSSILPHQHIIPSKYLQQLLLDQCLTQHLTQMLENYILPFCFSRSSLVNPVFKKNIFFLVLIIKSKRAAYGVMWKRYSMRLQQQNKNFTSQHIHKCYQFFLHKYWYDVPILCNKRSMSMRYQNILENLVWRQDDVIENLFGSFLKWKHVISYGDARMWHILSNHMTYFFIREWYECARISGIVWLTTIDMTRGNLWRFEDIYINEGKRLWTRKLVERCKFYLP